MLSHLKRRLAPTDDLRALVGTYEIPVSSTGAIEVLSLLRDPEASMVEIAGRVEMDPKVTVKILRLVNSAGFGLSKEVSNITHAVSLLGRSRLESIVLTVVAAERLPRSMMGIEASLFWTAAARRATVARVFAAELHAATQAEAFTAGLLLDIGIPVLAQVRGDDYVRVLEQWWEHGGDLVDIERPALGFDHAEVGGLMAVEWGLPSRLVHAIESHHEADGDDLPDPAIRIASTVGYRYPEDEIEHVVEAAGEFGFEEEWVRERVQGCFAEAEGFASFLSG